MIAMMKANNILFLLGSLLVSMNLHAGDVETAKKTDDQKNSSIVVAPKREILNSLIPLPPVSNDEFKLIARVDSFAKLENFRDQVAIQRTIQYMAAKDYEDSEVQIKITHLVNMYKHNGNYEILVYSKKFRSEQAAQDYVKSNYCSFSGEKLENEKGNGRRRSLDYRSSYECRYKKNQEEIKVPIHRHVIIPAQDLIEMLKDEKSVISGQARAHEKKACEGVQVAVDDPYVSCMNAGPNADITKCADPKPASLGLQIISVKYYLQENVVDSEKGKTNPRPVPVNVEGQVHCGNSVDEVFKQ